jgi:hypothetical protein
VNPSTFSEFNMVSEPFATFVNPSLVTCSYIYLIILEFFPFNCFLIVDANNFLLPNPNLIYDHLFVGSVLV